MKFVPTLTIYDQNCWTVKFEVTRDSAKSNRMSIDNRALRLAHRKFSGLLFKGAIADGSKIMKVRCEGESLSV